MNSPPAPAECEVLVCGWEIWIYVWAVDSAQTSLRRASTSIGRYFWCTMLTVIQLYHSGLCSPGELLPYGSRMTSGRGAAH